MTISGKYELSHALAESSFRSFHARHTVTGRQVMVHFLTGGSANGRSLAEVMAGLNAERQAQLLDAGDHEGTSYLVTVPIDAFTTLQAWLGEPGGGTGATVTMEVPRPKTAPPQPAVTLETPLPRTSPPPQPSLTLETPRPKTGPPPQPSAGDFTQVFGGSTAAPGTPAGPAPAEAGSFTQMFGPPSARTPAVSTGTVPTGSPAPRADEGPADGGSFTQFFNQPHGAVLPPPPHPLATPRPHTPTPPARTGDAGEFTQFFEVPQPPVRPAPTSVPPFAAPPPAPHRAADRGASEFTEFFRAPDAAAPLPPPSRLDPPPPVMRPNVPTVDPLGGATEFFHVPPPPRAATSQDVPSMPAVSGPSDFTMMLGGRGGAAPPPAASASASPVSEWPPFSPASLPVAAPSVTLPKASTLPQAPTLPPLPANPSAGTRRMILIAALSFVVTLGFMVIVYLVFRGGR